MFERESQKWERHADAAAAAAIRQKDVHEEITDSAIDSSIKRETFSPLLSLKPVAVPAVQMSAMYTHTRTHIHTFNNIIIVIVAQCV